MDAASSYKNALVYHQLLGIAASANYTLRAFAVVLISFVPVAIINGIVIWALRIGGTPVPPA